MMMMIKKQKNLLAVFIKIGWQLRPVSRHGNVKRKVGEKKVADYRFVPRKNVFY